MALVGVGSASTTFPMHPGARILQPEGPSEAGSSLSHGSLSNSPFQVPCFQELPGAANLLPS